MTQEQKELLLKDLCARLPYGVKCHKSTYRPDLPEELICTVNNSNHNCVQLGTYLYKLEDVKPYLFPLSSMTEEQRNELHSLMIRDSYGILYHTIESFDYCYKNNIDIRGLIPMGLANDATNKNIY
jgi:hypothetical protein